MAKKESKKGNLFRIKPAARHILTIGSGLVKDSDTALLELVKNSYDADATGVSIDFSTTQEGKAPGIKIAVRDDGHGMSYETVTGVWMVPSTHFKQEKKTSEKKHRALQGRKGIGRYAASILGNQLRLETTRDGVTTVAALDWNEFEKKEYLDEVEIEIDQEKTGATSGTLIEVTGDSIKLAEWDPKEIERFVRDLRRLMSPVHEKDPGVDFHITLSFKDFPADGYENKTLTIEPFPVLDVFDYRISGTVSSKGVADLLFENGIQASTKEKISFGVLLDDGALHCGNLKVDFKLYDRDTESIDNLISKLADKAQNPSDGEKLTRSEAKTLLNDISGIAVYRSGFRIRPHGDPGYDWLELDRRRVQRPGLRVGSERVSGYMEIEPEETSHLEEKSNREGLKENRYYEGLRQTAKAILLEAENRRYAFKLKTGKERSKRNLGEKLENLFDFSDVASSIEEQLAEKDVPAAERKRIVGMIDAKVEESNRVIEDVKQIIAIYQGQATLGKIVKVVLHEGRNPLSYFQNQIPVMEKWIEELKTKFNQTLLNQFIDRLGTIKSQAESLVSLFNKISPLAAKRRSSPSTINVKKNLEEIGEVFVFELKEKKVTLAIACDDDIKVTAWPEDFSQTFINLLDNSLYWLGVKEKAGARIDVSVTSSDNVVRIDFSDNGPGIEEKYIKEELIFEPGFSTKPDGTGLGLAIAGEAMERSAGKLTAIYSDTGAHFEIELPAVSQESHETTSRRR
jgi:signal transduction histidine kinase